jgi:choline monooxygenase
MAHNIDPSLTTIVEPIERAETLPSFCYTEAYWHEADVKHILKPRWQYIGHVSQLKSNGDVLPSQILGEPVIVVRDRDELKAFYNVCKHRGGPIATEAENCKMLQCKYHGWTYKLDGSLRGVPKFKYAELFDKKDYGLSPIPLELWNGFIFIRLGPEKEPLSKHITGISEAIDPLCLSDFVFHHRVTYPMGCNWKVYADNYLEGYHIPHVHPELCELLDMDNYKTVVNDWQILQDSPLIDKESIYQGGDEKAWYFFVYPNMMLNILPGRMQLNQILPLNERNCLVHFDYFYTEEILRQHPNLPTLDSAYSNKVQAEDCEICEHVQLGLQSSAYEAGRFSVETEQGVYAFQNLVRKDYSKMGSNND